MTEKTEKTNISPEASDEKLLVLMENVVSSACEKKDGVYVPVVSGVTCRMYEEECWGIGASESRFSHVFCSLLGNMQPYLEGRMRVGKIGVYAKKRKVLPHIFYFDTDEMLFNNMTFLEELMFTDISGEKNSVRLQKQYLDLLVELGLGYLSLCVVGTLSKVEKFFLLYLIAAFSDSPIIIADMNDVMLKQDEIEHLGKIVDLIRKKHKLLVMGTSQPSVIGMLCDKVVYLSNGKMLYAGDKEELIKNSDNMVCALTASDPENFVRELSRIYPGYRFEIIGGTIYMHNETTKPFDSEAFLSALAENHLSPHTIRISIGRIANAFEQLDYLLNKSAEKPEKQ